MSTLPSDLRNRLEHVVIEARDAAEVGARAALEALAVNHYEPYPHMKPAQRELRNHLRARARQLGDQKLPRADTSGKDHEINHLAGECAYEHWHRMLFARFLAENNLLIEPEANMAISLTEAEELAAEAGVDVWVYASRCAQRMLPQIFRSDDPLLQVTFATEHMLKLEKLLALLQAVVFTASDALGWVYQFWQSKKKDEVNRSEVKIGADEISAVTQFFTEPYMVEFLLHNTLGAWWAGKKLAAKDAASAKTEEELRAKLALPSVTWNYLRFIQGENGKGGPWRPAAGRFDGWPKSAKAIKGLDPCCGSGHFLVAFLRHLVPIRMIEEGLSAREAVDAVLRDNIYGLEIDERCCEIAAFALALAAWTYPAASGYRELPELHIACTGIGPQATEQQWVKLAEQSGMPTQTDDRERVKNGLLNLHRLFSQAPTLGSLIDPTQLKADVFTAGYETIQPYLAAVLKAEKADDETREQAIAAAGMVKAADLLAGKYTIAFTNVPYLGRIRQNTILRTHLERYFEPAKSDLATSFLMRSFGYSDDQSTIAIVTPQNWWFLASYVEVRKWLLSRQRLLLAATLGEEAWEAFGDRGPMAALLIANRNQSSDEDRVSGINALPKPTIGMKIDELIHGDITLSSQGQQYRNPDHRILVEVLESFDLLDVYAEGLQGISSADLGRFRRSHWECISVSAPWAPIMSAFPETTLYAGRDSVLKLEELKSIGDQLGAAIRGSKVWGQDSVVVRSMRHMAVAIGNGEPFDANVACILPRNPEHLPAIWAFCSSSKYAETLRKLDKKTGITNATLVKAPFELDHWQKVAAEKYPHGLPEPESDDPTQWIFHGRPEESTAALQVAVARLLGYRWPAELDDKMRLSNRARALVKKCEELAKFTDNDGIVCIPAVRGEEPAAERLLQQLVACDIEPGVDLDDWLRNGFFEEHCKLFHDRPFVWHVWDGRKRDGFHALVNYHKLCGEGGKGRHLLESLSYAYLGEWITRQRDGVKRGAEGAEDRLAAALELQKRLETILVGEPPFDIFVRWKPLHDQPIGWEPDINDGVRLNIRPFMASDIPGGKTSAGILRYKPNIKWTKDRGKEPPRPKDEYPWFWSWDEKTADFIGGKSFDGNRWNDCHYTNGAKQRAREAMGLLKKGGGDA